MMHPDSINEIHIENIPYGLKTEDIYTNGEGLPMEMKLGKELQFEGNFDLKRKRYGKDDFLCIIHYYCGGRKWFNAGED
jgi:hypothetical protein